MLGKSLDILDLEGQVRDVGAHIDGAAGVELANLDFFLAPWRLEKDQLRAPRRGVAAGLLQAEDIAIKGGRFLQIGDSIAGMEESLHHFCFGFSGSALSVGVGAWALPIAHKFKIQNQNPIFR